MKNNQGWHKFLGYLLFKHTWGNTPQNFNYLLESGPLVVQASPTR